MGAEHTRTRLIDAGEALIAEHGVDGVSLRRIGAAAGERNSAVVQYHFGSKERLVAAIFQRRMAEIDAERVALLAQMKGAGRPLDLYAVVEAAVRPLADFLLRGGGEGGAYVLFLAEVQRTSFDRVLRAVRETGVAGMSEVMALARRHLRHLPDDVFQVRRSLVFSYVIHALADYAWALRRAEKRPTAGQAEFFAGNVIDTAVGLWSAPVTTCCRGLT